MVKKYFVFTMVCLFALSGIAMAAGKNSSPAKNGNCPVVQQPAGQGNVAKNGSGPMQQRGGQGAVAKKGIGPVSQLGSECVPVTVNGIVADIESQPCTMVVSTTLEGEVTNVTVYGIGSDSCWEANNMSKPVVTDEVTIECCQITFPDGSAKLRATSVTIDEHTIWLIDADGKRLCPPPAPQTGSQNRFGNRVGR